MPDVAWRSYSYTVYKSDRGTKRARIIPDVAWRGYIQIRQGYKADKNYSGCTHGAAIYTNHTGVQSGQELFRMYAWRGYIYKRARIIRHGGKIFVKQFFKN